jgi:hypothetical protein
MHEIYECLSSHGFSTRHEVRQRLEQCSKREISGFLDSYLERAKKRPLAIRAPRGATDIYPDSRAGLLPLAIVQQLAIYARRIYVHDPVLDMVDEWQNLDSTMPVVAKYPEGGERVAYFRAKLAPIIESLLLLQPLAEAGIIYIAPTELARPRKRAGELYLEDLYGPESTRGDGLGSYRTIQDLPPQLGKYCEASLRVWPAQFVNGDPVLLPSQPLTPRNMIAVQFPDDSPKYYQLFDISFPPGPGTSAEGESSGRFVGVFDFENRQGTDPRTFQNWVEGSKYEMVTEVLSQLEHDLVMASLARARFITSLKSSRDLASLSLDLGPVGTSADTVAALLQFDLPYFENADFASIVKARQNEAAFAEFTSAMDKAFREIEALPDSSEFQSKVNEIYRDLLIAPLSGIERRMKILRRNLFIDAAVLLGSLAATFITKGSTLVTAAALVAASEIAKMYKQEKAEEDKVQQLPSFFYWEVIKGKTGP